jgi:hypothetical protein
MHSNELANQPGNLGRGHEPPDVATVRVVLVGVALISILMLACVVVFAWLKVRHITASNTTGAAMIDARSIPPEPRLEADPDRVLRDYQHEQQAALDSYRWIDRSNGVVQIPIERAMQLLVERGESSSP